MDRNELADIMEDQYVVEQEVRENIIKQEQQEDDLEQEELEEVSNGEVSENEEDFVPNEPEPAVESEETTGVRRSNRAGNVPTRLGTFIQHVHTVENTDNTDEYTDSTASNCTYNVSLRNYKLEKNE